MPRSLGRYSFHSLRRLVCCGRTGRCFVSGFPAGGSGCICFGRVAEWLKAHDWKSCGLTPTWVRIPPRPLAGGARHRTAWAFEPRVEPPGASRPRLTFGAVGAAPRLRIPSGRGGGAVSGAAIEPSDKVADAAPPRLAIGPASRGLGCESPASAGAAILLASGWGRQLCASSPVGGNDFRGVAQSGRALRSGRRGPRFKSGRPDFDSRLRGFRP